MNPYHVLEIEYNADDDTIRNAYLELVKRYPPDRHPERFRQISEAYALLRDEKARLKYYLFNTETGFMSPFEVLCSHFSMQARNDPPDFEQMKEYLRKCAVK